GDEEALERLEQLHAQQGDWRAVVSVLEQKVEATAEESDKIDLLKRIADLWTRELEDESSAARAFERVLDIDLADFDATVALEGIYDRSERWEELAGLSVDRLEVVEDPWERLQLLRRAADLYRDRLDKPDGAFVLLGTAALENPADPE